MIVDSPKVKNSYRSIVLVVLLYIVLAFAWSIPLLSTIHTNIAGSTDAFTVLSRPINIARQYPLDSLQDVVHAAKYFLSPSHLFEFYTLTQFFHVLFGEPLAYNIVWYLSFVTAGLGMYLLVGHLTGNRTAAFISGVIYSFSPLHTAFSLGFGGAMHIEMIPFFAYFLIRFLQSFRYSDFLFAALVFLIIASNEPHFALYTVLFSLCLVAFRFFVKPPTQSEKKRIFITLIFFGLAAAFLVIRSWPQLRVHFSSNNFLNPGINQTVNNSADALSFFTPIEFHPLWGNFFQKTVAIHFNGNGAERSVYIGFTVLLLIIFSRFVRDKKSIRFWLTLAIVFSIFSLGPFLHFLGIVKPDIPLPYLFLYRYVPFFEDIRATGRIYIIASLAFSVLAGYGLAFLLQRSTNKHRLVLPGVFLLGIMLEFSAVIPTTPIAPPDFYRRLNDEPGTFSIMQPLIDTNYAYATDALYYDSYHNKRPLGNEFADLYTRKKPRANAYETDTPVIDDLMHYLPFGSDAMTARFFQSPLDQVGTYLLNRENVRYIIFDKNTIRSNPGYITPKNYAYLRSIIEHDLRVTKVEDDNQLLVYRVEHTDEKPIVMTLDEGWDQPPTPTTSRWAAQRATFKIENLGTTDRKLQISLVLGAPKLSDVNEYERVDFSANGTTVASYRIGQADQAFTFFAEGLRPGINDLTLHAYDKFGQLVQSTQAVQVQRIRYEEVQNTDIPSYYSSALQDAAPGSLLQLPTLTTYSLGTDQSGNATLRGRKLVTTNSAWSSITDGKSLKFDYAWFYAAAQLIKRYVDYNQLTRTRDILDPTYFREKGQQVVNALNIRYLTIDKNLLDEASRKNFDNYLDSFLSPRTIVSDTPEGVLLQLNNRPVSLPNIDPLIGNHWGELFWTKPGPIPCPSQCRLALEGANLTLLVRESSAPTTLSFAVSTDHFPASFALTLDDVSLPDVETISTMVRIPLPALGAGRHRLNIHTPSKNLYISNLSLSY